MKKTRKFALRSIVFMLFSLFCMYLNVQAGSVNVNFKAAYIQNDARQILQSVNALRTGSNAWYWNEDNATKTVCASLQPLIYDYDLEQTAMQRAREIAIYYSHTRPDQTSCFSIYPSKFTNSWKGENIAYGYSTAQAVYTAWEEANVFYSGQGHRRNMLNTHFNTIGIGHVRYHGVDFWVQEFSYTATPNTNPTAVSNAEQPMNVILDQSYIINMNLAFSSSQYVLDYDKVMEAPKASFHLSTSDSWANKNMPVEFPINYTVSDPSIFQLSNGAIKGLKAGTAALFASGLGYQSSISVKVNPIPISTASIQLSQTTFGYDRTPKCPSIASASWNGHILTAGTDFSISYVNSTGRGNASVILTGNGNYTGTTTLSYQIICYHTNTAIDPAVAPTCINSGLSEGKHCTVCGDILIRQNQISALGHTPVVNAAVHPTCTQNGLTEGRHCSRCRVILTAQQQIPATGHSIVIASTTKATTKANGSISYHCQNCLGEKSTSTIYAIKSCTLSKTSFVYSGKVQKPTIVVKDASGKTIPSSNYKLSFSSGSKAVGSYKATITFRGNYSGTVKKTYKIIPKTTSITGLTALTKGFTAKIKKLTSQTTGYQIQYSLKKDFSSPKSVYVTNTTTTKKITGLSSKKTYYVRIRTYKKVNGTSYYSGWSAAKTVKTK